MAHHFQEEVQHLFNGCILRMGPLTSLEEGELQYQAHCLHLPTTASREEVEAAKRAEREARKLVEDQRATRLQEEGVDQRYHGPAKLMDVESMEEEVELCLALARAGETWQRVHRSWGGELLRHLRVAGVKASIYYEKGGRDGSGAIVDFAQ